MGNEGDFNMKTRQITLEDREKIIDAFMEEDVREYSKYDKNDEHDNISYFVFKLDDDCDDCFYDHSIPFSKILDELKCVCMGFQFNNDYYEKGDINTYYGMWFEKFLK